MAVQPTGCTALGLLQGLSAAGTLVTVVAKTSVFVGFSVISVARPSATEWQNEDVAPITGKCLYLKTKTQRAKPPTPLC